MTLLEFMNVKKDSGRLEISEDAEERCVCLERQSTLTFKYTTLHAPCAL